MILVTGAAGFIGSNLVASLNESGRDDIVVCDRLQSDGRWENLAKRGFHNIVRPEELAAYLDGPAGGAIDLVLHMSAISDTTATEGDLNMRDNFRTTRALWMWCAARKVVLVYASSAATYGDRARGFDDKLDLGGPRQLSLYSWSKHIFDCHALSAHTEQPARWYGLKLFNVFGPNEYHKGDMRSLVWKLAPQILVGNPARLFASHREDFGDGQQSRDFIWIEDVCTAVLHFAKGCAPSGIYNIGTGIARSFKDLVTAAWRAVGQEPDITYVPMPDGLRAGYQYFTRADMAKTSRVRVRSRVQAVEEAVEQYITRYVSQPDRYR